MYEIRDGTNRFHIIRLEEPVTQEEVEELSSRLREIDRDTIEPLLLLTDLRGCSAVDESWAGELKFIVRVSERGVKAHVVVVEEGSELAGTVRELVDVDENRPIVTTLNDAHRALSDHFATAEDFAFSDYFNQYR